MTEGTRDGVLDVVRHGRHTSVVFNRGHATLLSRAGLLLPVVAAFLLMWGSDGTAAQTGSPAKPSSSPSLPAPVGLRWDGTFHVPDPPADLRPRNQYLQLVGWSQGFAALESVGGESTQLWISFDGRGWYAEPLPYDPKEGFDTLYAARDGVVVVNMTGSLGGWKLDFWLTQGGSWRRIGHAEVLPQRPDDQVGAQAWPLGDRLAILVTLGPNQCCGDRPSQIALRAGGHGAAAVSDGLRHVEWISDDGSSWAKYRLPGFVYPIDELAGGWYGTRMATNDVWLTESPDGLHWRDRFELPSVDPEGSFVLRATASGYALTSISSADDADPAAPTLFWGTRDGDFRPVFGGVGSSLGDIVVTDDGRTVVVGGTQYTGDPIEQRVDGLALESRDGGLTYERSAGWPVMRGSSLGMLALTGDTVVARLGNPDEAWPDFAVADLSAGAAAP